MRNAYLDDLKDEQYAEIVAEERKRVDALGYSYFNISADAYEWSKERPSKDMSKYVKLCTLEEFKNDDSI